MTIDFDKFEDLTGEIVQESSRREGSVGERIRILRKEKGITLSALSDLTGFDEAFLTGIEKGDVSPQLGTVIKLSKALDSAFSRLVSDVGDRLYAITRRNMRKVVSRSTGGKGGRQLYTYMSLAPEVKGRHMEALMVRLEENPEGEMSIHEGEEFIFVLEGTVIFRIGNETHELEPGDSVYYLSTTQHMVAAKSGSAAILAVLYEG